MSTLAPARAAGNTVCDPRPPRLWGSEEEQLLRELYPTDVPLGEIAHRLGRTVVAVKVRVCLLGLTSHVNRIQELWGKLTPPEMAAEVFGDASQVRRVAAFGNRLKKDWLSAWPPAVLNRITELSRSGLSDLQIARVMPEVFGAYPGYRGGARAVGKLRRRLGLPAAYAFGDQKAGIATLVNGIAERNATISRKYGLPPMHSRYVAILLILADGPTTRGNIGHRLGLRTKFNGLGALRTLGLVARVERDISDGGRRRRLPGIYTLTPKAMDLLATAGKKEGGVA